MALSLKQTHAMKAILRRGMKIASMGYPDIIVEVGHIDGLEYRKDSEIICKRHGLQKRPIPDAHSFFGLLGCTLDVYDIIQERGCEILCDLNHEIPFNDRYDIVLDVGTAEHCFNIGQALMNMASLVKLGGYILHENPFNCGNHGFYSLNPTLFADFYETNGFKILDCRLVNKNGDVIVPHTKRFRFMSHEANVFCIAQRIDVKSFVFPVQSKYANVIPAAGVDRAKEIVNG